MHQLTEDHHDDELRLTTFYNGNGKACGNLGIKLDEIDSLCAVAVTSDGVHESCRPNELKLFLLHCIERKIRINDEFTQLMKDFLMDNISDNYSCAMLYRYLTKDQLKKIASSLEK